MSGFKVLSLFRRNGFAFGRSLVASYSSKWPGDVPGLSKSLVTGGAQGIGYIICDRLLRQGHRVTFTDINFQKAEETLAKFADLYGKERVTFRYCDISGPEDLEETLDIMATNRGRIKLIVNNVGIVNEYDAKHTLDVNLMATIRGCEAALTFMGTHSRGYGTGGTVINIGSIPSFLPYPNAPVYTATKHAIIGLTRSYGHESHRKYHGVKFMALCPSYVNTPLLQTAKPLDVYKHTSEMKFVEPEAVGNGLMKLLNDDINGSVLMVLPDRMEYAEIPEQMKNLPFSW